MNTVLSSADRRRSSRFARLSRLVACAALPVLVFAACDEQGILEPAPRSSTLPAVSGAPIHAAIVVTPDYSTFSTRAEFSGHGVIAHQNAFDEFSGALVYIQPTPWATSGITYTSGLNIVLGPGIGLGVQSNAVSTEFGSPLTGAFAAGDAFTRFAADLTTIGSQVPVGVVLYTNLGSYTFPGLDVPLATAGSRFFGVALSRSGEYLTGFRFSIGGAGSALLLDNVTVGHVGVANAEPVASAGGPYAGVEGSPVVLALGGSDSDGDALSFAWDLGDGTTGSGPVPPSSHTYADDGEYDVSLTVSDGRGEEHTAHAAVSVANVAPAISAFAMPATPLPLTLSGVAVPIATTYSDPGTLDEHTATLDCGTGATAADAPNGTVAGTCTYTAPGVYTVRVTVYDDDGGADTRMATGQVVVYDAGAGWLTGGGWIASPAGAYAPAPLVDGKLTFGFVARYGRSAETPDGSAELKLNLGKLDFRSTALEWLVVSGGVAHLRGYGTVNGAGDFGFALTAIDGLSGDAVRVRIWNRADGVVVYDNQAGESMDSAAASELGGGGITVHAR